MLYPRGRSAHDLKPRLLDELGFFFCPKAENNIDARSFNPTKVKENSCMGCKTPEPRVFIGTTPLNAEWKAHCITADMKNDPLHLDEKEGALLNCLMNCEKGLRDVWSRDCSKCNKYYPVPKHSGRNLCFSLPPHVKIQSLYVFWVYLHTLVCEAYTVYVAVQTWTDKHMMKVTNPSIQNHTTQLNSFWQATHKSRGQTMLLQGYSCDEKD